MKDMASKKISTAMASALLIAFNNGQVRKGDNQRDALLGLAGLVTSGTLTALCERGALVLVNREGNINDFEITRTGLRALCENEIISAEAYSNTLRKWAEWMDVTHAEALEMNEKLDVLRAALGLGPIEETDGRRADPQTGDAYSRSMRHGAEVVKVVGRRADHIQYRFLDRHGRAASGPKSLRLDRFVERYARVPA